MLENITSPQPHCWNIDNQTIQFMQDAGLKVLSDILSQSKKSAFAEKVINALLIYSKSSLEQEPEGKLIYIFSSLETLLLKSENEPIQQNIGERIAFLIGQDRTERRLIIETVKQVYGMRSQFFHHGHGIEDLESLEKFMRYTWDTFLNIIVNAPRFETKEKFISALEDKKLS